MVIVKDFTGKMNLDAHPSRMPLQDYLDALNLTRNADASSKDGPMAGIVGTRNTIYEQPAGTNKCIGAKEDPLRDRIIFFVWNSNGYHTIRKFVKSTRTIIKIFESITDSAGVDILNLRERYKVNSIDIIHRDEGGDLLLFNDGFNRPGCLNIDDFESGVYGDLVSDDMIRLAKMPGLNELEPAYEDDPSRPVNNLKKKLFQFAFAWGYKENQVSTISPISRVAYPVDAYSSETESDPGKNNVITLQVTGGPLDYKFIRIFGRESLGETWGDWFVIDTLDRDNYQIDPGGTYIYRFLNDGQYVWADQRYMDLIFDYVSDICNSQCLANGNVVVQAGPTDGYDPIARADVNVQISSSLEDTAGSGTEPANPTITYTTSTFAVNIRRTDFKIGPSIAEGCVYNIKFHLPVYEGTDYNPVAQYIAGSGDTPADVAQAMAASINSQINPVGLRECVYIAPDIIRVQTQPYHIDNIVTSTEFPVFFTGGSATWKWGTKYRLGIVYVDEYGKTNGVVSFVSDEEDPTDFGFTTPQFAFNNDPVSPHYGNPQLPVVWASINSQPPSWAVAYYWVRTPNQTAQRFLQYVTSEVQSDVNYLYLCVENLIAFKADNTGFVPSYTFQSGDRIRVYANFNSTDPKYTIFDRVYDYEILGTVQRDMSISTGDPTQGMFLKVKKAGGDPVFADNVFIELYSPLVRSSDTTTVFYAFGQSYPIYTDTDTGLRYHVGQIQNQTDSQPATFKFIEGDVYYKFRDFYKLNETTGKIDPTTVSQIGLMDANYSDYWRSAVNSNSRGWVIEHNAQRLYRPADIRFGQAFQPGTDINGINRFYPEDFIEANRSYGDIMKIFPWNNFIIVAQKFKIGASPVYQAMTFNADNSSNLILSSNLLNRIQYYRGEYGVGSLPESIAYNNDAIYGWDNNRGVCWRLAQNGVTPLSLIYGFNNFAVKRAGLRGFDSKIYGVFDTHNNLYISVFEGAGDDPAITIAWSEQDSGLEGRRGYSPEMICCLNNLLVSFVNGALWTHDGDINSFYGEQHGSSVTVVFNSAGLTRKTWTNISEQSTHPWGVSEIKTSNISHGSVYQESKVPISSFDRNDDFYDSPIFQDQNSGDLVTGFSLKGSYMIAKFEREAEQEIGELNSVSARFIENPLNNN